MENNWKFVKEKDLMFEKVLGREHHWHYHPELTQEGDCFMLKVVIKEGEGHTFHKHPEMNEILYVLKGKVEQWVESDKQILKTGESVYIPANVVHASFNAGKEDLELLAILSPQEGWESGTVDVFDELPYSKYR